MREYNTEQSIMLLSALNTCVGALRLYATVKQEKLQAFADEQKDEGFVKVAETSETKVSPGQQI